MAFLQETQTDFVLLDIEMPHINGIECVQLIRSQYPAIIVILLTTFAEEQYIIDGLANGAQSYLLRTTPFEYLGPHIRDAINGTFVMPAPIAAKLASLLLQQKKDFHEKSISFSLRMKEKFLYLAQRAQRTQRLSAYRTAAACCGAKNRIA